MKSLAPILLSVSVAAASALTYDLQTDYSTTLNPNGTWSYLLNGVVATASTRGADSFGPPGAPAIWGGGFAGWSQSNGSESSSYDLAVGDIYAHTPGGGGTVGIDWTASAAGTVSIAGDGWLLRDIGRTVDLAVYLNSTLLGFYTLTSGDAYDRASPLTYSFSSLAVLPGDLVRLEASSASTGDYFGVNLSVDLTTVASIPDAGSSAALLCFGLAPLLLARRRSFSH